MTTLGALGGHLLADVPPPRSGGEITAIVAGAIAVAAIIGVVVWRTMKRKKKPE